MLTGSNHPLLVSSSSTALVAAKLQHLPFFDARSEGLQVLAQSPAYGPGDNIKTKRFCRTPEGKAVAIVRENGEGELWMVNETMDALIRGQTWSCDGAVAIFDTGIATFIASRNPLMIILRP